MAQLTIWCQVQWCNLAGHAAQLTHTHTQGTLFHFHLTFHQTMANLNNWRHINLMKKLQNKIKMYRVSIRSLYSWQANVKIVAYWGDDWKLLTNLTLSNTVPVSVNFMWHPPTDVTVVLFHNYTYCAFSWKEANFHGSFNRISFINTIPGIQKSNMISNFDNYLVHSTNLTNCLCNEFWYCKGTLWILCIFSGVYKTLYQL